MDYFKLRKLLFLLEELRYYADDTDAIDDVLELVRELIDDGTE